MLAQSFAVPGLIHAQIKKYVRLLIGIEHIQKMILLQVRARGPSRGYELDNKKSDVMIKVIN